MIKIWNFIRHNPCIVTGFIACCFILIYAYSCQSTVISLVDPKSRITREGLVAEVDSILAQAELRFADLDRQDLVRDTIFNSVLDLAQGKSANPIGVILSLAGILGIGAVGDNIKKRTYINTLKGESLDGKVKESLKKILQPSPN